MNKIIIISLVICLLSCQVVSAHGYGPSTTGEWILVTVLFTPVLVCMWVKDGCVKAWKWVSSPFRHKDKITDNATVFTHNLKMTELARVQYE